MARIHIVRHGNTFDAGDTVTRVGARTDLPLSSSGKQQAAALAQYYRNTSFSAAFCSPLSRTRETARAILAERSDAPLLLIEPFLTEIDYGVDENQPEAAVVARLGQAAIAAWDRDAIVPEGWHVDVNSIINGWRDLFARTAGLGEDADLLVVTSNGIARFALDAAPISPHDAARKLKTGAWGVVEVDAQGVAAIMSWNERP